MWVGIGCLNLFINAILWDGNAILKDVWFCDICEYLHTISNRSSDRILATRITLAMNVAMPICSLVINRRLYFIATSDTVLASKKEVG